MTMARSETPERWKYEMLSDVVRLQNVAEGIWDHGLSDPGDVFWNKPKIRMPESELKFLLERDDLFAVRRRGLALYLTRFDYSDVKEAWARLLAELASDSKVDEKFDLSLPSRRTKVSTVSVGSLYLGCYKTKQSRPATEE